MATITRRPLTAWTRTPPNSWDGDVRALPKELTGELQGEVGCDAGSRALYATDASNYRQVPIGVVWPRTIQDVVRTMEIARRYRAPILNRGGGTSLAGQCCNVAVVVEMSRHLNRVLEVDPQRRLARVQPGTVLDVRQMAAEKHHLEFGPEPSTHRPGRSSANGTAGRRAGQARAVS